MEQARLDNFRNYAEGQGLIASRYETEINPMTKSFVSSGLYKSTIYETLRGLASLPDNRMGQISKKFM